MDPSVLAVMIPIVSIIGGLAVAALSIHHKFKLRELRYRERIAMIEKGVVPAPEVGPGQFEEAFGTRSGRHLAYRAERRRSAGINLIAVGVGLMVLMKFIGEEARQGMGAGAFLMILGLGFLVNSLLAKRDRDDRDASRPPSRSLPPSDTGG